MNIDQFQFGSKKNNIHTASDNLTGSKSHRKFPSLSPSTNDDKCLESNHKYPQPIVARVAKAAALILDFAFTVINIKIDT